MLCVCVRYLWWGGTNSSPSAATKRAGMKHLMQRDAEMDMVRLVKVRTERKEGGSEGGGRAGSRVKEGIENKGKEGEREDVE